GSVRALCAVRPPAPRCTLFPYTTLFRSQKDLVLSLYLKRDYAKALEGVKSLVNRDDADEVCFQLAGNVYKALENPKECEKVYKKDRKSTRLNSSHVKISYAVFCLKKKRT